jgi:hypothetical protein
MAMEFWYHLADVPNPARLIDDLLLEIEGRLLEDAQTDEVSDEPAPDAA